MPVKLFLEVFSFTAKELLMFVAKISMQRGRYVGPWSDPLSAAFARIVILGDVSWREFFDSHSGWRESCVIFVISVTEEVGRVIVSSLKDFKVVLLSHLSMHDLFLKSWIVS